MPNTRWSDLNALQLGRYAEYYSKMEFASYGLDIYSSEVDDHGIDFVAKSKTGIFWEIQVKSFRNMGYVFMPKKYFNIEQSNLLLHLLLFVDGSIPTSFVIPATEWTKPNSLLCYHDYVGKQSDPEYGVNLSKKNMPLLLPYDIDRMIQKIGDIKR